MQAPCLVKSQENITVVEKLVPWIIKGRKVESGSSS